MTLLAEILRNACAWLIVGASVGLLFWTGFGVNGIALVYFFAALVGVFLLMALFQDDEHLYLSYHEIGWSLVRFLVLLGILGYWVTVADYYLVELIKLFGFSLEQTRYWPVFFGGLVPAALTTTGLTYYVASNHFSNTLRFLVLSVFFLNANLNDLGYYLLFGREFPETWSWVIQPQFLFGLNPTTLEVSLWAGLSIVMGILAALLPYEILILDALDTTFEFRKPRLAKFFEGWILGLSVAATIIFGSFLIPQLQDNLSQIQTDITWQNPTETSALSATASPESITALNLIATLQDTYQRTGAYPESTGNCREDWDSSQNGLPFSTPSLAPYGSQQNCFLDRDNQTIMYYSDGQRFTLLVPAANTAVNHPYYYLPRVKDVRWYDTPDFFWQTWSWDTPMLVYFFAEGEDVADFVSLN